MSVHAKQYSKLNGYLHYIIELKRELVHGSCGLCVNLDVLI